MFDKKRIVFQLLHLQLIDDIPECEIRLFPQVGPFDPIEIPHPVDLEAGYTDDRKEHQRHSKRDDYPNPVGMQQIYAAGQLQITD